METLRCMRAFVAVADHGSFSRAAVHLQVSAVMVGKYIQQLEAHLGTALLQRNTRRQRLTEAGVAYLAGCRQVLEQVQQAEASVAGLQLQPRGLLRVSAPTTWGSCVLAPALASLLQAQPLVNIELDLSNRTVDLIEDGFDAAIRVGALPSGALVARAMPPYAMSLCASPAYLRRRGTPQVPSDLAAHDCLSHLAWRGGHGWQLANGEPVDWEGAGAAEQQRWAGAAAGGAGRCRSGAATHGTAGGRHRRGAAGCVAGRPSASAAANEPDLPA
ncbi:DNA-binding transcriptional LysR family regulator [Stenotrophomonas sp. SORGH_AS321]|nr:DNA-binding transcriptional LysR family regulator [Stenotrophomonas sp. SORGH_AS_0321]